jgi:hypothetical protein
MRGGRRRGGGKCQESGVYAAAPEEPGVQGGVQGRVGFQGDRQLPEPEKGATIGSTKAYLQSRYDFVH